MKGSRWRRRRCCPSRSTARSAVPGASAPRRCRAAVVGGAGAAGTAGAVGGAAIRGGSGRRGASRGGAGVAVGGVTGGGGGRVRSIGRGAGAASVGSLLLGTTGQGEPEGSSVFGRAGHLASRGGGGSTTRSAGRSAGALRDPLRPGCGGPGLPWVAPSPRLGRGGVGRGAAGPVPSRRRRLEGRRAAEGRRRRNEVHDVDLRLVGLAPEEARTWRLQPPKPSMCPRNDTAEPVRHRVLGEGDETTGKR